MTGVTREAAATFADMICADQQWVDAEFDALISAAFSEPPAPPPPAPPRLPPRRPGASHPRSRRARPRPPGLTVLVTGPPRSRQRSPPAHPPA